MLRHWLAVFGDWISTRLYVKPRNCSFEEMRKHHEKMRDYLIENGPASSIKGPVVFEWMSVIFGREKTRQYWEWNSFNQNHET